MKSIFIYALCEPGTKTVRYIGKTSRPEKRLREHLASASRKQTHRDCWLSSLPSGQFPAMEILDEVSAEKWEFFERAYIQVHREAGFDLTNATDGGEGVSEGTKLSDEHKAKISRAVRGRVFSDLHRARISAASKGYKKSAAHCAKISEAKTGIKASAATRKKMSDARRGSGNPRFGKIPSEEQRIKARASWTPEMREKMSARYRGKPLSAEARANMSVAQKRRWAK